MNITDLEKVYKRHINKLAKLVKIEDGWVTLETGKGTGSYDIRLTRIKNAADILRWTNHLAAKTWVKQDVLRHFVRLCCGHLKIDLSVRG